MIEGCRGNDRASQKELYNMLREYAMKICYRYQNNLEQVEEIMNEGFIKLLGISTNSRKHGTPISWPR